MRELGKESPELHEDIARQIIELAPSFVVLVGEEMRKYVVSPVKEALGEARVYHFANSKIAGQRIRELLYEIE